jgi:hypothetical protein
MAFVFAWAAALAWPETSTEEWRAPDANNPAKRTQMPRVAILLSFRSSRFGAGN